MLLTHRGYHLDTTRSCSLLHACARERRQAGPLQRAGTIAWSVLAEPTFGETKMQLNPQQQAAVEQIEGPVLVLAGAGSGKTRVITERIRYMLRSGVNAQSILALTFTNKAAAEMRERLGQASEGMSLGTFHGLGLRLVREFHDELGLPGQISILDQSEQNSVLRRVCSRVRTHLGRQIDLVASFLSSARNEGLDSESLKDSDDDDHYALGLLMERYNEEKRILGAVDFDDLIDLPLKLLDDHPQVLAQLRKRWRYTLVDEYQDTNTMQFQFLSKLMGPSGNLCVVGDDDQSIYGWRGADQRNILDFERQFPGCTAIYLTANYRCKSPILDAANQLIACNRHRKEKILTAARGEGSPVRLQVFADNELEAEVVVRDMARLARAGIHLDEMAILIRRSAQAPLFEAELGRRELNFRLIGGKRTADKKAARDLFAYMQVIASDRNEVAFRRAISTPSRGIGAATIESLRTLADSQGKGIAAVSSSEVESMRAPARQALDSFQADILAARRELKAGTSPKKVLRSVLDSSNYDDRVREEISNEKALLRHLADLERTLDLVERSWSNASLGNSPRAKLNAFVNRMTLASAQDESADKKGRITLSTIHGVKGLEFDRVWVAGIEEGSLPTQRSIDSDDLGEIEEERRLLYVAITRARDHLVLTRSEEAVRGERRAMRIPSRFLHDLEGCGIVQEDIEELPQRDSTELKQDHAALLERLAKLGISVPGSS